jgi:hypothetical protein
MSLAVGNAPNLEVSPLRLHVALPRFCVVSVLSFAHRCLLSLMSPRTTRAKPCEHFGGLPLLTRDAPAGLLGNPYPEYRMNWLSEEICQYPTGIRRRDAFFRDPDTAHCFLPARGAGYNLIILNEGVSTCSRNNLSTSAGRLGADGSTRGFCCVQCPGDGHGCWSLLATSHVGGRHRTGLRQRCARHRASLRRAI